ncbi:MAG: ribosome assembly factor SBDS [Euryarchaeota archaeon]|nr:ribosome assembly factor SBDS [Euryarchaeota archaeon]|tara:strand:+ start:771 stop:1469 length:699 start_codon:yes stop_codon:yes gene_type:complete
MVSLDDAVLARYEHGGKRFEILIDPQLVDSYRNDPDSVELDTFLATDEVWLDARGGERPTSDQLLSAFGSANIDECVSKIMDKGTIQLTTVQRKERVVSMKAAIIHKIASTAIDPRSKMPHPPSRIETALEESRYSVDPFLSIDRQVTDAIKLMRPLIPLKFATARLAFRIPGVEYGSVQTLLRELVIKEEWLANGDWACVVEVPAGSKIDLMGDIAKRSKGSDVKIIDEGS